MDSSRTASSYIKTLDNLINVILQFNKITPSFINIMVAKTLFILFFLLPFLGLAQQEQSIWMIGQNAGLDFTKNPGTLLTAGSMTAKGGGATMSDAFGNLLFYTDGVQVWNKNHQLMTNGTGLKGNPDVNQTVVIVPRPLHLHKYYIFTTDSRQTNAPNALRYSEVDMLLQGGLGEVVQKNKLVLADVSEKITATFHGNNQDFWLLTHTWNSNSFLAYQIAKDGIIDTPVKTNSGSRYSGNLESGKGSFRLSLHQGISKSTAVVVALPDLKIFETSYFDSNKGLFGYFNSAASIYEKAAYAEIELDRLYTVSLKGDEIFEYELANYKVNDLQQTSRSIAKGVGFGDLRLARDGLIYVAARDNSIHTITYGGSHNQPFPVSKPASFKANAIALGRNQTVNGFPNTIANYLQMYFSWRYDSGCIGSPINFFMWNYPNSIDSIQWNFDDPASGAANFSKVFQPTHVFKSPGKLYKVQVKIFARGTVQDESIPYDATNTVSLGNDTTLCFTPGKSLVLKPNLGRVNNYKWQDGSTSPTFKVTKPGIYWLETLNINGGCPYRDSIIVKGLPVPQVNLGNDTTICTGKTLLLKAGNAGSTYKWQDGSLQPTYLVSKPGMYKVTVTNAYGCMASDSIRVYYLNPPSINLGSDTTICAGTEYVLNGKLPGVSFKWHDGSTASTFKVTKAGTYWVDATIDVCTARDSIVIKTRQGCLGELFAPNIITPNGDGMNDTFVLLDPDKSSIWQLEVFNRLGKSVFKSTAYNNKWDAAGLADGVYYYLLQDDKNRKLRGYVEVIR